MASILGVLVHISIGFEDILLSSIFSEIWGNLNVNFNFQNKSEIFA